jgi:hypothetical protein
MMIDEYDLPIEEALSDLLPLANTREIDLMIEPTFEDERASRSCMIYRPDRNRYGIMSVEVQEYPDDDIVYFTFNPDLYNYAKMEGFDSIGMVNDMNVFMKVSKEQYFDHMVGVDG